jgi:hypothetical protein
MEEHRNPASFYAPRLSYDQVRKQIQDHFEGATAPSQTLRFWNLGYSI